MIEMFASKIQFQNGGHQLSATSFLPRMSGSLHRLPQGFFPKDRLFSHYKTYPSSYEAIVHKYKIERDGKQTGPFTGTDIKPAEKSKKIEYCLQK